MSTFKSVQTLYHLESPVEQKFKTVYIHPSTQSSHRITVRYKYNAEIPTALENQLIRDSRYSSWDEKEKVLIPMVSDQLDQLANFFTTVTGLELRTTPNGDLEWSIYEDVEEIVKRLSVDLVPRNIAKINATEITQRQNLFGPVFTANVQGEQRVLKVHQSPHQNKLFPAELHARIAISSVPHIATMVGVAVDEHSDIEGMILESCDQGDLKSLLESDGPDIPLSRKERWAAQIVHGIMEIHSAGVLHGDLRCRNIVIDSHDNAKLIDITNGQGFTEGWTSICDESMDPRRDIYGFGVTLWEIVNNGADPAFESSVSGTFGEIIQDCVVDDANLRPSLDHVFNVLGGKTVCGCACETSSKSVE